MPDETQISNSPFFILGSGRSGSSLLSLMLNRHANLAVPYESHIFNTFYTNLKYYGDLSWEGNREALLRDILATQVMRDWTPPLALDEVKSLIHSHDFKGIFQACMECWCQKTNKKRWGEKTPHHIYYWQTIESFFPDVKWIHIYRDGRDVALSLNKARFGPKTVPAAALYWKRYLNIIHDIKQNSSHDRFLEVSYESLLDHPENVLKDLCEFLGEAYDPPMMEFHLSKMEYGTDSRNQQNLKRPLLKSNTQKWKAEIAPKYQKDFEEIAGEQLIQYGYPRVFPDLQSNKDRLSFLQKMNSLFRSILFKAKNGKGIKDQIIRIKIIWGSKFAFFIGKRTPKKKRELKDSNE